MPPNPAEDPFVERFRTVKLWFVGLECNVRQESEDEVFGTVGVTIPSTRSTSVHHFPLADETLQMGKDGARTVRTEILVYEGPPTDIVLSSTLVEHDSGDAEEYRRRVADMLVEAAMMGGAAVGVPAEATAASHGWLGDLSLGLVNVVASALGADDDPYTPQATRLTAYEMLEAFGVATGTIAGRQSVFANRVMERPDTPGVKLKYNIDPVMVSGTDHGNDTGHYAFYYGIDLVEDRRTVFNHAG